MHRDHILRTLGYQLSGGGWGEKESERVGAQRELKAHVRDDRLFALLPP
jgi:hypothetical protein